MATLYFRQALFSESRNFNAVNLPTSGGIVMSHLSFPITDFLSESIYKIADAEAAAEAAETLLASLFTQLDTVVVDTGDTIIDDFEDSEGISAYWLYAVAKNGVGLRAGIIIADWDSVSGSVPSFHDGVSTNDIGDTSGVVFTVNKLLHTVRLQIAAPSDGWSVYMRRMLLG